VKIAVLNTAFDQEKPTLQASAVNKGIGTPC
jgi:hypothetical protein